MFSSECNAEEPHVFNAMVFHAGEIFIVMDLLCFVVFTRGSTVFRDLSLRTAGFLASVGIIQNFPSSFDTDFGYPHAALSGMESIYKRIEADNKKYIFWVTRKFSRTDGNGRRCILHFQIHNCVSGITRLF